MRVAGNVGSGSLIMQLMTMDAPGALLIHSALERRLPKTLCVHNSNHFSVCSEDWKTGF
jgi:hypothetical protein